MLSLKKSPGPEEWLQENQFVKILCSPAYRWLRHLLPVLLIALAVQTNDYQEQWKPFIHIAAVMYLLILPYITLYVLVPQLFLRRYLIFCAGALSLISAMYLLVRLSEWLLRDLQNPDVVFQPDTRADVITFFTIMLVLLLAAAAIKLFQQWVQITYRQAMVDNMNLQLELENLKKQLTPHFFFNTLNNLDVLIYLDQDKASTMVHKFSNLLRYQLYLNTEHKIMLSKEIDFLTDYLYLEKIRHDHLLTHIEKNGSYSQMMIHPLLLLPFVENAVKHNDYQLNPDIDIRFSAENGSLFFSCSNPISKVSPSEPGGTGLKNITRRLSILYPGQHSLEISTENNRYTVNLFLYELHSCR